MKFSYKKIFLFVAAGLFFLECAAVVKEEKRMAVVIPSYNNALWYKHNLDSLFNQEYSNWHAIYVDDCSHDGTAQLVADYVRECGMQDRVHIIANTERKGALANHYIATHLCDDWDIVVQLDGDDWFPDTKVLSLLNETYEDQNVWLTYGSFEDWPKGVRGYCKQTPQKIVNDRLYRETYWTPGQLRTFYAWVFKRIKLEDLLWDHDDASFGKFYPASCDLAFSYPMMEMVGSHFKYIDKIIYIHNVQSPINDFKVNRVPQIVASNILLHKKKYEPVMVPPARTKKQFKGIDIFVIADSFSDDCSYTIDSCIEHVDAISNIYVVDTQGFSIAQYQDGHLMNRQNFLSLKQLLVKSLHNWWYSSEHVFFIHNGMRCVEPLHAQEMVNVIDEAQAFGCFPAVAITDPSQAPCVHLHDGYYVWRLAYADRSWISGDQRLCMLSRKELIRERIAYLDDTLITQSLLPNLFAPGMLFIQDPTITRIGFAFTTPKVVAQ